jgi:ATP-dependent RNA helicase DeaD
MKFTEIDLKESLQKAVAEMGYETPTEIQQKAIPALLDEERDFIGQAQTGTGKTAAFLLPLLNRIEPKRAFQALILAPTRELANQIDEELRKFAKFEKCRSEVVYGGSSYERQIRGIKKNRPEIIVGTPGRVMDLMRQGVLKFQDTDYFILDEADEMLKMGFFEDVQEILSVFPDDRKMWMFSATMPAPIVDLIHDECNDPITVKIKKKNATNDDVEQRYYVVQNRHRVEALHRLLAVEQDPYAIIFCQTKRETQELYALLADRKMKVECLNGDMGQAQRDMAMDRFKSKKVSVMVCTDVAARGIDVDNLTHVINFGLPRESESYVHRIGRTGRAGNKGVAMTLIDPRDIGRVKRLNTSLKQRMTEHMLPSVEILKESFVKNNILQMQDIANAITEKGDGFKIDPSFDHYEEFFEGLSKEQLLKVLFTHSFNKEFRRLNDFGELKQGADQRSRSRNRNRSGRNDRDGRGDGRRGDRDSRRRDARGNRDDHRGGDGRRRKRFDDDDNRGNRAPRGERPKRNRRSKFRN